MRELRDDNVNIKNYIFAILRKQGRNFDVCELCGKNIKGKAVIHHEKYEGATIYDIKIACQSCNTLSINKGLR